ncbi:hypothetical protein [Paraburkholderia caribensis]|uniref:hypothetical protein n=1 Tax=Paraburkholderia caribensis TaxID=75105 RepID=UPI0004B8D5C0
MILAWLRKQFGDTAVADAARRCDGATKPHLSSICRQLGTVAPNFSQPSPAGEESLTTIRQILARRLSRDHAANLLAANGACRHG